MLPTDRQLARRCLGGEQGAFVALHRRHVARVFHLLRRLTGDSEAAEDLTQETFLAAYRSLSQWRGDSPFGTWVCGIAFRQYRSFRRRASGCETDHLDDNLGSPVPLSDPFLHLTKREAQHLIEQAIGRLPDSCREAFLLVRVEGLSYREAAEWLEIPLGTVQSRLFRATGLLRRELAELGNGFLGSDRTCISHAGKENPDAM